MDHELYLAALENRFPICIDVDKLDNGRFRASYHQHNINIDVEDEDIAQAQNIAKAQILEELRLGHATLNYA